MTADVSVTCSECGKTLSEPPDEENRKPCQFCGSSARTINLLLKEDIHLHEFIDVKKKFPGYPHDKKLRVHLQQGDQLNHGTGKWIKKERLIDKEKNTYSEKIIEPETGKILRQANEPLKNHTGHGSDKEKDG